MTRNLKALLWFLLASVLVAALSKYAVKEPRCTCALGGYYGPDYDQPEDCAIHGVLTP